MPSHPASLPNSLAASFESAKQGKVSSFYFESVIHRSTLCNLNQVHKVLEAGFNGIPQPRETERYLFGVIHCSSGRTLMTLIMNRPKYYVLSDRGPQWCVSTAACICANSAPLC